MAMKTGEFTAIANGNEIQVSVLGRKSMYKTVK
jgi:hypothetical protein